jgi:hypothetical protein
MENYKGLLGWFLSGVDNILITLGWSVNFLGRFFVGGFILLVLAAILIIVIQLVRYAAAAIRRFFLKTKSTKPVKKTKKDNGSMKKLPEKKLADLVWHEANPPLNGSLEWKRTGRVIRGVCLAERRKTLQESEEMLLLFPINGEWFYFWNPKLLVRHQIELFHKEIESEKERGDLSFNWLGQPSKIFPENRAQYEVEIGKGGHYPHLGQNEKRVSLLLVELEEVEINEGVIDRILLFEDTALSGGIAWQGKKIYLWRGGRLSDRLDEKEIAEILDHYLEKDVNGVELDLDRMI